MLVHYLYLTLSALTGLAILIFSEISWRRKLFRGESARKIAHILIGIFASTWPLYLDWFEIRLISIALTIGFIVCMRLRLFKALVDVERLSYGEVLYALAIGGLTLITQSEAVYAVAMLHLGLSDGLAAIVGKRFGKGNSYKVWGQRKSVVGSLAFLSVSVMILAVYSLMVLGSFNMPLVLAGSLAATILENIGVYGFDNILVPSFLVLLLRFF